MATKERVFSTKERRVARTALVSAVVLTAVVAMAKTFVLTPDVPVMELTPIAGVVQAQPLAAS